MAGRPSGIRCLRQINLDARINQPTSVFIRVYPWFYELCYRLSGPRAGIALDVFDVLYPNRYANQTAYACVQAFEGLSLRLWVVVAGW